MATVVAVNLIFVCLCLGGLKRLYFSDLRASPPNSNKGAGKLFANFLYYICQLVFFCPMPVVPLAV